MTKFIIRDKSGHRTKTVPLEQADQFADELRDQGYLIVVGKKQIAYGESVKHYDVLEAIPIATRG